jgi:hypothetical protein
MQPAWRAAPSRVQNARVCSSPHPTLLPSPKRRGIVANAWHGPPPLQALTGLAYMHARRRLHNAFSPGAVLLNTTSEQEPGALHVEIRELAFGVDVSDSALFGGGTLAELWEKKRTDAGRDPM